MPDPDSTPIKSPRKPKKRRRVLLWLGSLIVIGFIGILILASTGSLTGLVIPIIERQTGLEITQGSVVLTPSSDIEIRDAILRVPEIDGHGGEVIRFDRAIVSVKWGSILKGSKAISGVLLDRPRLRVSMDPETGFVNLQALKLRGSGGGEILTPAITISNGIIEVGEHAGSKYTKLKELSIIGSLAKPNASDEARFNFQASSTLPGMSSDSIPLTGDFMINGLLTKSGIVGEMTGLRLEDWPPRIVPSNYRDFYESLAMTGNLAPTKFNLPKSGDLRVILELNGVDVSMPFIPLAEFDGPEQFLRMRSTKGTIEFRKSGVIADLDGDINNLLYEMELDYKGYTQTSAFIGDLKTAFRIEEGFRPLRFLPPRVTEKLDRFDGLQADIVSTITLERPLANDDQILVSGTAAVSNGSARYEKFMYPFENIEGVVSFTPNGVQIQGITGSGPSGATLEANGHFDGLGEDSVVEIRIGVNDLPIDQHLLGAMDDDQRELVHTLFSRTQYNHLLESGYLLESDRRGELIAKRDALVQAIAKLPSDTPESERAERSAELSMINNTLRVPEFDFGGLIGVDVTLKRHPERESDDRWTTDIQAVIPNAGIVPKHFPLPIVARDVQISITDGSVLLKGGQYIGLSGGSATVEASFKPRPGTTKPRPSVKIKARKIPIDDRLIAAIPGYYDQQPDDPSEITLRRILDRLRMQGLVDANATIAPGPDGRITYIVEADIDEGSAHPLNMGLHTKQSQQQFTAKELGLDSVQLSDLIGTIHVTEAIIVVHLLGMMESPSQPIPPTPIELTTQLTLPNKPKSTDQQRVNGLLPTEFGPPVSGPQMYTNVRARGLDLAVPLEHAIAVLSPSFANRVIGWRTQYTPIGVLDMRATLEGRVGGSLDTTVQIDRVQEMEFAFSDHQYKLGTSIGSISIGLGTKPSIDSRGFGIPISIDNEPMGHLDLEGTMRLARGGQLLELSNEPPVTLSMKRGQLGSPGIRTIVNRMGSSQQSNNSESKSFLEFYGLEGVFDLFVKLKPIDGARISQAPPGTISLPRVEIDGSMTPHSLSMSRAGDELKFWNDEIEFDESGAAIKRANELSGKIRFDGLEGYFDNIVAKNDQYDLTVDGSWAVNPGDGADIEVDIGAKGDVLNGPMRVILPDTLTRVVDQLEVRTEQDINIDRLHIIADRLGTNTTEFTIDGSATMLGVNALVGVPITDLDGRVDFWVNSDQTQEDQETPRLEYQLDLHASLLRAGLLRVHNAHATILNDPDQRGVVLVPTLRAGMHGGMVSGNAQVRPGERGELWYSTEIRTSGVRAAPIFDDLFLPIEGLEGPPGPNSSAVRSAWNVDSDVSKGIMLADLAMSGPIGEPSKRVGRGFVRVSGGSIVALPGLINLIEASNLTLPTGARLNLAEAELYIDGPTMTFERLSASSRAIEILGYGTMDWTSRDIDLRFRSRSIEPIPIISNLIEGIRDELITIRVTGAPGSIAYSPEQFGMTRRMFDSLFGTPETEQHRRLREVESRTRVGSGLLRGNKKEQVIEPSRNADWDEWEDTQDPDPVEDNSESNSQSEYQTIENR